MMTSLEKQTPPSRAASPALETRRVASTTVEPKITLYALPLLAGVTAAVGL
jgi:hypothetical protein